ncbi:hypothetical protein JHK85_013143 [Glycine max]|nr:hypothetical protein JHK85_013143 [Glycine max]
MKVKSTVFLSPKFELGPGSATIRHYYDIEFPRGHVALKSFSGEVVDEAGNPVPLHETYLHHWIVVRYTINNRDILPQYYGLGSETRRTDTDVPDPFGIVVGNPAEIPQGDENGEPLRPDYKGGMFCCYDQMQCRLREGFDGTKRSLYLRYTIDYQVESCSTDHKDGNGCLDVKRTSLPMKKGGYVIYGVAHQRSDMEMEKKQEMRQITNYIVGMSTCYPPPGSVKIIYGKTFTMESNYSSSPGHTGVMGIFYLLVAEQLPRQHFKYSPRSSFFT